MYKEASKLKIRVLTPKGLLSVEQLWDLTPAELDTLAVSLEEEYKKSGKKSFLVAKSKKDKVVKLKFDVIVDILTTKVDEGSEALAIQNKKAFNAKIEAIIASKQDDELAGLSVKDLEKLIK